MINSLRKSERLKHRKKIDELFKSGKSFSIYPLRIYYKVERFNSVITDQQGLAHGLRPRPGVLAGVGVSKRHFRKAVDRNRIKRLLRESYRTQKHGLTGLVDSLQIRVDLFLIYTGRELPGLEICEKATGQSLEKLQRLLFEKPQTPII
ncbi:ribonuclease P protein component [Flavihumibacter sediminis]|nr:ribonuclease P protein component [Flavihumibacter sediminis]